MQILAQRLKILVSDALEKVEIAPIVPELAIQYAITLPMSHAHTAVAGPPDVIGAPKVAGTEPSTPRIEIAYETVDHFEKCRCSTCKIGWSSLHRTQ
jgi:hypothetical protein